MALDFQFLEINKLLKDANFVCLLLFRIESIGAIRNFQSNTILMRKEEKKSCFYSVSFKCAYLLLFFKYLMQKIRLFCSLQLQMYT